MLKAGELLMLSTVEYSDWEIAGPFRVLRDFDIHDIAELVKNGPSMRLDWPIKNGPDDVVEYLKNNNFITDFPYKTFHLGSYGDINVTPEKENV